MVFAVNVMTSSVLLASNVMPCTFSASTSTCEETLTTGSWRQIPSHACSRIAHHHQQRTAPDFIATQPCLQQSTHLLDQASISTDAPTHPSPHHHQSKGPSTRHHSSLYQASTFPPSATSLKNAHPAPPDPPTASTATSRAPPPTQKPSSKPNRTVAAATPLYQVSAILRRSSSGFASAGSTSQRSFPVCLSRN